MSPVICILNVANMAVSVIQDFPDMCAPAQAIWAPDDNGMWTCTPERILVWIYLISCNQKRITFWNEQRSIVWYLLDSLSGIVFVGFQQYAYKLGLTYCKNRHSKLYVYDLDQHTFCTIGETDKAIYSPRYLIIQSYIHKYICLVQYISIRLLSY